MGMIKNLILLLAFTSFLTNHAYSQQDTSRLYEWNGRMVKYVKIQKGKTLYSLSKETNTPQDSIIGINPELSNGLKTGKSEYAIIACANDFGLSKRRPAFAITRGHHEQTSAQILSKK
jgi:hypothetical protein